MQIRRDFRSQSSDSFVPDFLGKMLSKLSTDLYNVRRIWVMAPKILSQILTHNQLYESLSDSKCESE